jgi:hypothetical protein
MPGLLTTAVTDEQRRAHDTHRTWVVASVLAVVFVYMFLFTYVHETLGLPAPRDILRSAGMDIHNVFDSDRNVESSVEVEVAQRYETNDDERLVLFLALVGAFLSAYYLPLGLKQISLTLWATVAIVLLFGVPAAAGLIAAHTTVYLTLHPRESSALVWGALPGLLAAIALGGAEDAPSPFIVLLPLLSAVVYQRVWLRLLSRPRAARWLRTLVVQSALVTVCVAALVEGLGGEEWVLPLGVLYFFWQWERVIMYHIDYQDGSVPADITLWRYLAVFITPAAIPNISRRVAIGQGYTYLDRVYLCEDKNRIALGGLKLLLVALAYLVFGDWLRWALVDLLEGAGVPVFEARITNMIREFHAGAEVGTASVLMTTLLDLVRWVMIYAAIAHFKVGVWRLCGYGVHPSFDKPWLATNLVTFWARFTFHYREFLVRAFYYPVFFRYFRKHTFLRVMVATLAAVTVGNLIWGHLVERFYFSGLEYRQFGNMFRAWPYFVLLGLGIGFTEIYLLKRKRTRRPWTLDRRIVTDVVAAYCTVQFYALIHIFIVSRGGADNWELFRLFMTAFGVSIPA